MSNRFWVVDTNIIISALLDAKSMPRKAFEKAASCGTLLISKDITKEYFNVLNRKKFDKYVALETRLEFFDYLLNNSLFVEVLEQVNLCRDTKDNMILSLAKAAQADCIISGDNDLLILHPFEGIPIVNASDFLSRF